MKYRSLLLAIAACIVSFSSCVGDLDVEPIDPNVTLPEDVLDSEGAYAQLLAKCYAGLTVSSSSGPDGGPDIDGIDGGYGQYLRAIFYNNEFTTDEALTCWNDKTAFDLHAMAWASSDVFVYCMFSRIYYQIGLCNEFIRRAATSGFDSQAMKTYVAEARALRLLSYLHAIDMFGNVPFATEKNSVGSTGPGRITRADLFAWMDEECDELLKEGSDLLGSKQNVYGRLDADFVRMIQAKLNLNAAVYLGIKDAAAKEYYDKAATLCKAIKTTYPALYSEYTHLFMADNHLRTDEIIFNIPQDGQLTKNYGGTTFLVKASIKGGDAAWYAAMGANDGWGGIMVTPEFLGKFDESKDKRFLFWGGGPEPAEGEWPRDIADVKNFATGWTSYKFCNLCSDGSAAPNADDGFSDIDYPLFRSADAYLMLAEAQLRGATTVTEAEAKEAWNAVRTRAGLNELTASQYNLDELIDERGRELYWEGWRRSDLIRFGKYTSDAYNWAWKGNIKEGTSVNDKYALMPIPASELNSNKSLKQNPGY